MLRSSLRVRNGIRQRASATFKRSSLCVRQGKRHNARTAAETSPGVCVIERSPPKCAFLIVGIAFALVTARLLCFFAAFLIVGLR